MPRSIGTPPGWGASGDAEKSPVLTAGAAPQESPELLQGQAWKPQQDSQEPLGEPAPLWRNRTGQERIGVLPEERQDQAPLQPVPCSHLLPRPC